MPSLVDKNRGTAASHTAATLSSFCRSVATVGRVDELATVQLVPAEPRPDRRCASRVEGAFEVRAINTEMLTEFGGSNSQ